MPTKKKTTSGPKATLMKKNLAQLKAQAKKLKIKGFSTKKKEALVNSIMMAQARKKKSSAPKKSMAAGKRMMKKRGAKPNRVMRRPVRPMAQRRKPTMSQQSYYEADFNGFGYMELDEAGKLLSFYAADPTSALTPLALDYFGAGYSGSYVKVGFNANSGNVFLIDEDYNVVMANGGKLDLFISLPYSGEEGFYDDLMDIYEDLDLEDQEYLDSLQ